jgi:hypothetical protein
MPQDPGDIHLEKFGTENPGSVDPGSVPPRNRRPVALLAIVAVVLLLALAGGYFYLRRPPNEPSAPIAASQEPSKTPPSQQAEPGDKILLPPLDETDALVRLLVGRLSSHPTVVAWLTTDGLILNFVTVTTNIANGDTPASELKAVGPVPRFRARSARDVLYLDPSTYGRYDRYADAVSKLDARGTARLYATLKPRIREAYQRVAGVDETFDPVLERAIAELLKVPVVEGNVALVPKGIVYGFENASLEGMSAAQKQFLRMGPQNVRTVQSKLREIALYLGIPESRWPHPAPLSK